MPQETTVSPSRSGRRALGIVLTATIVSFLGTAALVAIWLSMRMDGLGRPMGSSDLLFGFLWVPGWAVPVFLIVFGLQVLLTVLGLVGLVMAIVAAARNQGHREALIGIIVALAVPALTFVAFAAVALTRMHF